MSTKIIIINLCDMCPYFLAKLVSRCRIGGHPEVDIDGFVVPDDCPLDDLGREKELDFEE